MSNPRPHHDAVLDTIRTRRAVRSFTEIPVADDLIRQVIEAGRWASSASNRRVHRFQVVRDPVRVKLIRSISPGLRGNPPVLIVICTDLERAEQEGVHLDRDTTTWIDVGTAVMNMMIAAHALGLGSCPVTSFSVPGAAVILDHPPTIRPELILMLGYPAPNAGRKPGAIVERINLDDIIDWDYPGGRADAARDPAKEA
jgi:nitroreductase